MTVIRARDIAPALPSSRTKYTEPGKIIMRFLNSHRWEDCMRQDELWFPKSLASFVFRLVQAKNSMVWIFSVCASSWRIAYYRVKENKLRLMLNNVVLAVIFHVNRRWLKESLVILSLSNLIALALLISKRYVAIFSSAQSRYVPCAFRCA